MLRYLKGREIMACCIQQKSGQQAIVVFLDADCVGNANDYKTRSGCLFMVSGAPVRWKSKKQTCVALSIAEAKYVALTAATQETTLLMQLLKDFHNEQIESTVIYEYNQSAICKAQNTQYHRKTKHIDINYHFVREKLSDRTTELRFCQINDMLADMITKGLTHDNLLNLGIRLI